MKLYHKVLYSRILPNGKRMCLKIGTNSEYLVWDDFKFGSDSIIVSFRYKKYRYMIEQVANSMPNWQAYMESYIKKSYTVGGEIIFPKYKGGINQTRGCNQYICDRWDLTLECIRRYYIGETSPLYTVLHKNKSFLIYLSILGVMLTIFSCKIVYLKTMILLYFGLEVENLKNIHFRKQYLSI